MFNGKIHYFYGHFQWRIWGYPVFRTKWEWKALMQLRQLRSLSLGRLIALNTSTDINMKDVTKPPRSNYKAETQQYVNIGECRHYVQKTSNRCSVDVFSGFSHNDMLYHQLPCGWSIIQEHYEAIWWNQWEIGMRKEKVPTGPTWRMFAVNCLEYMTRLRLKLMCIYIYIHIYTYISMYINIHVLLCWINHI